MDKKSSSNKNPRPKYKFLRRNIVLDENRDRILTKVKIKKVYLKEIHDKSFHLNKLRTLDLKIINNLTGLRVFTSFTTMVTPYCLNFFRAARNLRKLTFIAVMSARVQNSLCYFKRMSKNLEFLDLDGSELTIQLEHVQRLYRVVSTMVNLKIFRRAFEYYNEHQETVIKEYPLIDRYLSRRRKLLEFNYGQSDLNQRSFQRVMKQSQSCRGMTDLSLVIDTNRFEHIDGLGRILHIETSEGSSQGYIDNQSEMDFLSQGSMSFSEDEKTQTREEIVPFFRFDLFPNLKKLQIMITESYRCPLGPFVIEGCKALQKLEVITVTLEGRPAGMKYLFDGLLTLPPSLTSFSLEIPFIRPEESDKLAQFFGNQKELIFLSLHLQKQGNTMAKNEKLSNCLKNIWQYIEDKPKLKYLRIHTIHTPIENISYGLSIATGVQGVKELEIEACDDSMESVLSASPRAEGLCEFLVGQKDTLQRLKIALQSVIDANLLNNIIKAVSLLKELKDLELLINVDDNDVSENSSETSEISSPDEKSQPRSMHFDDTYIELRRTLKGLPKLSNLILDINPLIENEQPFNNDSLKIFNILPSVKSLKTVFLRLPFDKTNEEVKKSIAAALSGLSNVTLLDVRTSCEQKNVVIQKVVSEVNRRQAMRCDLMF